MQYSFSPIRKAQADRKADFFIAAKSNSTNFRFRLTYVYLQKGDSLFVQRTGTKCSLLIAVTICLSIPKSIELLLDLVLVFFLTNVGIFELIFLSRMHYGY